MIGRNLSRNRPRGISLNEARESYHVSATTLYKWEELGAIKGIHVNNRVYYPQDDLEFLVRGLANGTTTPVAIRQDRPSLFARPTREGTPNTTPAAMLRGVNVAPPSGGRA